MPPKTRRVIATFFAVALALPGPLAAQTADANTESTGKSPALETVMATVGDTEITFGHMLTLRAGLPQQYDQLPPETLFKAVLDQLVQQTILMQAHDGPLSTHSRLRLENERRAVKASEVLLNVIGDNVTEDDIQAAYTEQFADVEPATEYKAAHILVETEEKAKDIIAQLEDGADFAKLARENSTGPTGASGGDLGWFGPDTMVAPFFDAVSKLEPDGISEPVETQFGWHVIKLEKTRDSKAPALDEVRSEIETELRRVAFNAFIAEREAETEINRADISDFDPARINDLTKLEN